MALGKRNRRFTATGRTNTGNDAWDSDGKLIRTSESGETTTFSFWGSIEDTQSAPVIHGSKRHNVRTIRISCDSRSITDLTLDHKLSYDGGSEEFEVVDIFDDNSGINFSKMVIAQYSN